MPERDACKFTSEIIDVRDTPAGRNDADAVAEDVMAAKRVKDGVPVAVLLGVLLPVSLLDADVVAVAVDDGVAPVVSDADGVWLLLRVPLRVPVPDALAPVETLAVAAADGDAPNDRDAAALAERDRVAVDEPDGET